MNESFPKELSFADAIAEVEIIKQNMQQAGSVDGELDKLSRIVAALIKKEIDPAEAIKEAHAIEKGRQDYH